MVDEKAIRWFSVRCVYRTKAAGAATADAAYEERVTLWRAASADHAIELAEAEAKEYATRIAGSADAYLDFAQSYELSDEPGDGAEIFSLIRESALAPTKYLDTFFDTGDEAQQILKGAIGTTQPDD